MAMNNQVTVAVIAALTLTLFTLSVGTTKAQWWGAGHRSHGRRIHFDDKDLYPTSTETPRTEHRGKLPKLSFTVGNDSASELYISEFYKLLNEDRHHGDTFKSANDKLSASLNSDFFGIVEAISVGLKRAVEECKYQFRWERWDCPVTSSSVLSKTSLNSANRETSFLQAITAAGIMYDVNRMCSLPNSSFCSCGGRSWLSSLAEEKKDWKWEGCNPHDLFGAKASAIVLGTHGQPRDVMAAVNSHNQRVGRETLIRYTKKCRCVGATATCPLKVCWMSFTKFHLIGSALKDMYKRSKRIKSSHPVLQNNTEKEHERFRTIKENLVHLEKSPNYCLPDISAGTTGTRGRECKMSKNETGRCRNMCTKCGYEIETVVREELQECDCKFHWCCRVECSSCLRKVSQYFCA